MREVNEVWKRLKYVGNIVYLLEISGKRFKYMGNCLGVWEAS